MANRREAVDVENPAEGFVTGSRNPATKSVLGVQIRDEQGKFLPRWSMIFVMSCVLAVSIDPLFFYILIIDQDMCLQMDKTLRTIVLVLRTLTDIIFTVHFVYKIYVSIKVQMHKKLRDNVPANTTKTMASTTQALVARSTQRLGALSTLNTETSIQTEGNLDRKSKGRVLIEFGKKIVQKMSWLSFSIINDFLALLPVPQLLIVVTFNHMRRSAYVEHKKVLNVFLLGQYLPRIYRIHQSSKELRKNAGIWVKGLFNFFLYILASHILGAFWYFFSIQRMISCWHSACVHSPDHSVCTNIFCCQRRTTTSTNKTFLEEHCPTNATDGAPSPYDFGIFLNSLKNHNSEHIKFGKKFLYSFWWGLRNISNFGTNLSTSTYVWENLFAILISVIGLLLFLYLIGNVQTLMQLEATKSEETRRKIRMKKLDVCKWISENNFPDDVKSEIMNSIDQALKENKDADVDKPFLILPWQTKRSVKRHLFKDTLKTVNKLKDMNEKVLTLMCDYLKPVTYIENSFVFRMGDPLDCMLFIVEGTVWTYASSDSQAGSSTSSMDIEPLGKGQFYGEELLDWASDTFSKLPVSRKHVKSQTKVEAFVLMAKDLETVVSRYKQYWYLVNSNNREEVALSTVRRFRTKAQQRPSSPPPRIADTNGESLPSTAGK